MGPEPRCAVGRVDVRAAPGRCPIDTPNHRFTIKNGQNIQSIQGRLQAVGLAKEMSSSTGRLIGLEREDGRVRMQFQRGSLQTYRYDTLDGR